MAQGSWDDMPCEHCGLWKSPEGHDGCLGDLGAAIMNACCGHGNDDHAYIQYWGWPQCWLGGEAARQEQRRIVRGRDGDS